MMLMMQPSLGGHLSGDPNIETLQRALLNLAQASGRSAINPGPVNGTLNDSTMSAVNSALGILTEELPSWMYLGLQAALILGSTTAQAKTYVTKYASQLAMAANTAAAKMHPASSEPFIMASPAFYAQQAATVTPTSVFAQLFAPGWYTTPLGLGMIALGLFGFWKFFIATPKTSQ